MSDYYEQKIGDMQDTIDELEAENEGLKLIEVLYRQAIDLDGDKLKYVEQLQAKITELENQLAEALKDKERLDWLSSRCSEAHIRQADFAWSINHISTKKPDIREAIDIARK